jgi:transposase InsO family protein
VGSTGDSYDNAIAQTINGLYKTELVRKKRPWKTAEALESETFNWVRWFNQTRLLVPSDTSRPQSLRHCTNVVSRKVQQSHD